MEDNDRWVRSVQWAAGDFGFRACPIFRLDILSADKKGVFLSPLRCYNKKEDASTILASSKKPTQLHPNGPEPSLFLPPTKRVSWVWRTKKCHAIGREFSRYKITEVPEIAKNREVFTLSIKKREKRIQEIQEEKTQKNGKEHAGKEKKQKDNTSKKEKNVGKKS